MTKSVEIENAVIRDKADVLECDLSCVGLTKIFIDKFGKKVFCQPQSYLPYYFASERTTVLNHLHIHFHQPYLLVNDMLGVIVPFF